MVLFKLRFFILLITINTLNAQIYRWRVKTLTDTAGQRVYNYNIAAIHDSISGLADTLIHPRPMKMELTKGKRANAEKVKVTFTAYIIATGMEDDGDYHLVMEDLKETKTLIAEIPNPETETLRDFKNLQNDYEIARREIDSLIGKPTSRVKPLHQKIKVSVTGFIFFDKRSHGNGHTLSGLEIHPIIKLNVLK